MIENISVYNLYYHPRFKSILDEIFKDPKQPQTIDHLKKFLDAGLYLFALISINFFAWFYFSGRR